MNLKIERYGFLSFAKSISKNLKNKYDQKLFDSAKKSTTDAIKTASKGAIQKTAEASGDLTGSKIADELMSVSKKPDPNIQTEAGAASSKDASRASPKDVPKKNTYLQNKGNKLLMN